VKKFISVFLAIMMTLGSFSVVNATDYSSSSSYVGTVTCYAKYFGTADSIVTALEDIGVDNSEEHIIKIAETNGINDYTGSPEQDATMLDLLRKGKLHPPECCNDGTMCPIESSTTSESSISLKNPDSTASSV